MATYLFYKTDSYLINNKHKEGEFISLLVLSHPHKPKAELDFHSG